MAFFDCGGASWYYCSSKVFSDTVKKSFRRSKLGLLSLKVPPVVVRALDFLICLGLSLGKSSVAC